MDSLSATYWLAASHLLLGCVALVAFPRPRVSVLHYSTVLQAFAFGVRPILAASVGGYSNYPTDLPWSAYNQGLLYQLGFSTLLLFSYWIVARNRSSPRPLEQIPPRRTILFVMGIALGAVAVLQAVGGSAWLPSARTTTIDSAVPGGKYIFPLAVIGVSMALPLAYLGWARVNWPSRMLLGAVVVLALVLGSLLQVRGFVMVGLVVTLWLIERSGTLPFRLVVLGGALFFAVGSALRPIGVWVSQTVSGIVPAQSTPRIEDAVEALGPAAAVRAGLLFTTNNDIADTWPVVFEYLKSHRPTLGSTFLAIPARFAPTRLRVAARLTTGSDLLNLYFYREDYTQLSFGFNVTLVNETVLNFGAFGILVGLLVGLMMGTADNWLLRVRALSPFALHMAFALFAIGFTGEPAASVQWLGGIVVVGAMTETLVRLSGRGLAGVRSRPVNRS